MVQNYSMTYDQRSSDDTRAWPLNEKRTWRERVTGFALWLGKVLVIATAIVLIAWESLR